MIKIKSRKTISIKLIRELININILERRTQVKCIGQRIQVFFISNGNIAHMVLTLSVSISLSEKFKLFQCKVKEYYINIKSIHFQTAY